MQATIELDVITTEGQARKLIIEPSLKVKDLFLE